MLMRQFTITDNDQDIIVTDYNARRAVERYIMEYDKEVPCKFKIQAHCLYDVDVSRVPTMDQLIILFKCLCTDKVAEVENVPNQE